jgi:hypothetical protein
MIPGVMAPNYQMGITAQACFTQINMGEGRGRVFLEEGF